MTNLKEVYKCTICGNIVEVIHAGGGILVCCGKEMVLMKENTSDASKEKHVPIIEEIEEGIKVKVGEIEHPMESEHYIEWIEVEVDGKVFKQFLKPGDKPEAEFKIKGEGIKARAYCNLHGLWSS